MNKAKLIFVIVILAVILMGGYFLLTNHQNPQPASQLQTQSFSADGISSNQENGQHLVTYTDSSYTPNTITIKAGEIITWKNESSRAMWTASGNHPTHTLYPTNGGCIGSTFDACKGVQPGNSWSFKFDIAGSWSYHNHLNPSDTGIVVVQ